MQLLHRLHYLMLNLTIIIHFIQLFSKILMTLIVNFSAQHYWILLMLRPYIKENFNMDFSYFLFLIFFHMIKFVVLKLVAFLLLAMFTTDFSKHFLKLPLFFLLPNSFFNSIMLLNF